MGRPRTPGPTWADLGPVTTCDDLWAWTGPGPGAREVSLDSVTTLGPIVFEKEND